MIEQFTTAIDKLGSQYDAIVVDEAQDFLENWWFPLQLLLEDPDDGILYLFYDDNQNIYGGLQRVKNLVQSDHSLRENCRNTQKINEIVNHFYNGSHPLTSLGPVGREVIVETYSNQREMYGVLRRTFHKLINDENVLPEDIVMLTPFSEKNSTLASSGTLGRFRLTTNWDIGPGEIYYTTIHSFKGLESPVIILAEIEPSLQHNVQELLYVACSRACSHLVIVAHQEMAKQVLAYME